MELHLFKLFSSHYYSYHKNAHPKKDHTLPPLILSNILNEFASHNFYSASGFWTDQFHEIADAMN